MNHELLEITGLTHFCVISPVSISKEEIQILIKTKLKMLLPFELCDKVTT
jgi:hypothetical protein